MFLDEKKSGEAQTNAKVPSLRGLIAWLETQDPTAEYVYHDCEGACLIGQYVNAIGLIWNENGDSPGRVWWRGHQFDVWGSISTGLPHTFGAALERARS